MLDINPYLHFMGNSEDAMNYYKSIFGGEFTNYLRFNDFPGGEKMAAEDRMKFMNITLTIDNGPTIMATDALESLGQTVSAGDNFHICIQAESEAETERIFNELAADGKVKMPLNKTFWGAYFGMCRDKFGIQWMINYTYPKTQ